MLSLLLLVTSSALMSSHLATSSIIAKSGFHAGQQGGEKDAHLDQRAGAARSRRSLPVVMTAPEKSFISEDLADEHLRVRRDVVDPRVMTRKRGDWAKTNLHMWGKRRAGKLRDLLQNEAAKKNSWDKNNVKIWGKRNYDDYVGDDNDDDGGDYSKLMARSNWLDRTPLVYFKRTSNTPSQMNDENQLEPSGWAKNAWEKTNMRIWG